MNMKGRQVAFIILLLLPTHLIAQKKKDSLRNQRDSIRIFQNLRNSQLVKQLERSITRRSFSDTVKQEKSEDKLKPYQGKIIRNIHTEHIGFNKSIYDSAKKVKSSVTHF